MDDHYYSPQPQSASRPKEIEFRIKGHVLTLKTDRGVFSKENVDFGTRLLIETFEFPNIEGPLLDMGCGYGVIGLSMKALYPDKKVTMVDINERAVVLASENARLNGLDANVFQSNLYDRVTGHYAAIISNPPIRAGKKVVHNILEGAKEFLLPGGELWVVIQKKQGAPSALKKLQEAYDEVSVVQKSKGYYVICAKKAG